MKDITYYLQFPAGEKEDKSQNGNGRVAVLNGDSEEAGSQKIHKGLFKTASVVENSSCPSLLSSEIKNSPSYVRTSTRRVRSKCKIQFKMINDTDNSNESVELDRHSTILQDKEDVSISQTTSIKTSVKELHDEAGSLQTVSVGKQKLKKKKKLSLSSQKVSNRDTTNKSLCVKSEVLNEIFVESSRKTEDSLLFQRNRKSSLFVKCKLKDTLKEPKQHGFGTDVTNETCTDDKTSDNISSRLNESNNAFHILMSSRIWQSPHEQGPDETKDHTNSNRKKTRIVIAEAPKETVEIKENRKKRKKKLNVVGKRRTKKAKLSDTSSEIEIGAAKKPVVRSKRVVIVPESDSDGDGNTALGQSIDTLKSKDEDKQVHRECGKMVVEETDDDYAEPSDEKELMKKHDKVVNQDSLMNSKLSTRTSRKMDRSESRLSHKTGSKRILEEIKDDCSEPEQDHLHLKKLVVKVEKISPEKLIQISTQKCYEGSEKKVQKGRMKLVMGGKGTKEKGSLREDRMVNCQLSVHRAKMSPKLLKSTKKFVIQCNKSPVKSFFERRVKLVKKSEQESGEFGKKKSETWIEDADSEEENQKQTEMNKKDKTNKAASVNTLDSNYELPAEPKKHVPFPEETKKRNSLFSYFNKVSKDEVLLKPEKIKVKVQIHSPPSSPSMKKRCTSVPEDKRKQNHCVKSKVLDMEDQIIVLESHIAKPATDGSSVFVITPKKHNEINGMKTPPSSGWKMRVRLRELSAQPVPDDTGDSSDDNIFIPKRRLVESKTPAQQMDAGETLQASWTGEKCMNSEEMENQDNVACVEGAEGELEVIICSNPDSKPNGMKLAPLFLRKPKTDPAIVEARRNFLKSGVPDSVKKLVDIQRSLEGEYHFLFPTVAHVQQQEDQLCVWNLPLVELPLNTTETEPPTLTSKQIEAVELGTFSNCCSTDPSCSFAKPSTPTPITCFQKLLRILKSESPDFPIYRAFRRLHSKYLQGVEKSTEKVLGKDIKQQKRRGGKSRVTRSNARTEGQKKICNWKSEVMWTEKYKPTSVDDLVGNRHSIDQLKHWLESWKQYSNEIQHRDKESGRNRKDSSSGDEFFDCDSNDNINKNLPNNTAILVGPHGCGKTSAVYAIANELGCKVLEINTSSKRNGKRILSELQEATQSHQVKSCSEHALGALGSFVKAKPTNSRKVKSKAIGDDSVPKEDGDDRNSSKMSIILVEGVDVVYDDQDEGFVSAVTSLVASSKRPVVLVTNDPHCPHLARFMDLHLVLKFRAPPSVRMSLWLQLICLLEGVWIRHAAIGRLLDHNHGDVRQTMLQLQFWVLTGGNNLLRTAKIPDKAISENPVALEVPEIDMADDYSNLSYISGDEADETPIDIPEHANCAETFTEYSEKYFQSCQLPFPLDLGLVWWNLASLISIPESLYRDRICIKSREVTGSETLHEVRTDSDDLDSVVKVSVCEVTEKETECVSMTISEREMKDRISLLDERLVEVGKGNSRESVFKRVHNDEDTKGNSISELLEEQGVRKNCCSQAEADRMSRLMETMSAIDVMSSGGASNREPCYRTWDQVPKDGTSLTEGAQCRWWENSVSRVLCHYLLEGNVHMCRTSLQEAGGCHVDVQVTKATFTKPTQQELRWRSVQHAADDTVLPAVPLWCRPDHHSVSCDYIPMLRTVCRYEQDRLACNTKRHSRFFHYLKGLSVHASDATCSTLCAVFANRHIT